MKNIDKKQLKSLCEEFGYSRVMNYISLNESFTNNILRNFFRINQKEHTTLNGEKEDALSPMGAAFALSFPILWDKIPEDNIEVRLDVRLKEHVPDNERLDNNTYDIISSAHKNIPEFRRNKLSSYVDNGIEQDRLTKEFNSAATIMKNRIIDRCKWYKNKFEGDIRGIINSGDNNDKEKINSLYEKIDVINDVIPFFDKYVNFMHDSVEMTTKKIKPDENKITLEELENVEKKLSEHGLLKHIPEFIKGALSNAINAYNSNVEDDNKHYGTEYKLRTQEDFLDKFTKIDDMKYVRTDNLIKSMLDKNMIDETEAEDITKSYGKEYIKNREDRIDFIGKYSHIYFGRKMRNSDFGSYDKERKEEFVKSVEDELKPPQKEITNEYKKIQSDIEKSGSSDSAVLLKELYMKGEKSSDSGRGELAHRAVEDIISYNFEKNGELKESTKDDFKLAILTDAKFRILYVISAVKIEGQYGFEHNNEYVFGWEKGITPAIMSEGNGVSKDRYGISQKEYKKNVDFSYNYIEPSTIYFDDRIRAAIIIKGRCDKSTTNSIDEFNDAFFKKFEGMAMTATDDEGKMRSENVDGVVSLLKKYKIPYKLGEDNTVDISYDEVYNDETMTNDFMNYVAPSLSMDMFNIRDFNNLFDNVKKSYGVLSMFDPKFTKFGNFEKWYKSEAEKHGQRYGNNLKYVNPYETYIATNKLYDSKRNRIAYDKKYMNLYSEYVETPAIELNNYLISRDSVVRMSVGSLKSKNLKDDIIKRQALQITRNNRYLTPDEEKEAENKKFNGVTNDDIRKYGENARKLQECYNSIDKMIESVSTAQVGLKGFTKLFKDALSTKKFSYSSYDKIKADVLSVLSKSRAYLKRVDEDKVEDVMDAVQDMIVMFADFISNLSSVSTSNEDATINEIADLIAEFERYMDEDVADNLYKLGLNIDLIN